MSIHSIFSVFSAFWQKLLPVGVCSVLVSFGLFNPLYALPQGLVNVLDYGADPSGQQDSTQAIQMAINDSQAKQLALWFPAGDYRVSQRLEINQLDDNGNYPAILLGQTLGSQRARLILSAYSPGFQDVNNRRAVLHFFNLGTADKESGNTGLFNQMLRHLDVLIETGNPGAVGIRMQGAEGCTLQDVLVDLRQGGHTGIWGIPASGGSSHGITVLGGQIGLDTRRVDGKGGGSQPQPVVSNLLLRDQSEAAVYASARGSLVLVGAHLEREQGGPLLKVSSHWPGQPFDASVQLIDSQVIYRQANVSNHVFQQEGQGRSLHLDNTWIFQAQTLGVAAIAANPTGWQQVQRLAVEVRGPARGFGQPKETIYVDGQPLTTPLHQASSGGMPPADLRQRHALPSNFPSWQHPNVVDITTLGAIGDGQTDNTAVLQQAIDNNEIIFIPKGNFRISDTLRLQATTKIIGLHPLLSQIEALSTPAQRFGQTLPTDADKPMLQTADTDNAETWLAFFHLKRHYPLTDHNPTASGNYALEWRSGGASLVNMLDIQAHPARYLRPDRVAVFFYKFTSDFKSIDPNQPQKSFPAGLWAWPNGSPPVVIRGHGGGRWYNFWLHGRNGLRENTPVLRIEGTQTPLHIYHLHVQQQDSKNHVEVVAASNVSIYGTKGEIKGSQVSFADCRNVRLFGHGGMSSPDVNYHPPYLFQFDNCDDFLIAGIADTINEGQGRWFGGEFDRWYWANIKTFFPLQDRHPQRPTITVPSDTRPIVYVRGNPRYVAASAYVPDSPVIPPESREILDFSAYPLKVAQTGNFTYNLGAWQIHSLKKSRMVAAGEAVLLESMNWNNTFTLARSDGQPFTLHALTLSASNPKETFSVSLTATFADSRSASLVEAFPAANLEKILTPAWSAVRKVQISGERGFKVGGITVSMTPVDPTPVDPTPVDPTPVDPPGVLPAVPVVVAMPENPGGNQGQGKIYYVKQQATNASDNNPGTATAPFLSLAKGLSVLKAGDTLLVGAGWYTPQADEYKNLDIGLQGTLQNYITIAGLPGERPVIYVDTWNGVQFWNAAYIEFRGFTVRGMDDPAVINPDDRRQFGNCLSLFGDKGNRGLRIVDNHVHHCGGNGIGVANSDQILIQGNRVWHNSHRSRNGNSGISITTPKDHLSSNGYGYVIPNNEIFDNVNQFAFRYAGMITDGNGLIFDYYANGGDKNTYQKRMLATNNLIYNNGGRGIHAFHFHRVDAVNNTTYGNVRSENLQAGHGELSAANSSDIRFYNNIAQATHSAWVLVFAGSTPQGIADNNLLTGGDIFNNGLSITNTLKQTPGFVVANPKQATDFHLSATSPAKEAGKPELTAAIVDFGYQERKPGGKLALGAWSYRNNP